LIQEEEGEEEEEEEEGPGAGGTEIGQRESTSTVSAGDLLSS
jgi:hypothetical protein